jgi:hypothetical protein
MSAALHGAYRHHQKLFRPQVADASHQGRIAMSSSGVLAGSIPGSRQTRTQTDCLDALSRRLETAGVDPVPLDAPDVRRPVIITNLSVEQDWGSLREQLEDESVTLAFADCVVPQCTLLSAEPATVVGTPLGLQVPAGSAWVCMRVDLMRFSTLCGTIDERSLRRALETCVDVGEMLHEAVRWPTPEQCHDAWLNRRLAVMIGGIGDVAACSKEAPGSHGTLRRLNQVLLDARQTLQSRSRAIALHSDRLPAITQSDPSYHLPAGSIRDDWKRHWQRAVRASLVRHRNLLALSPWSMFPTNRPADSCYAEFLPLLRHADVIAFDKNVSTSHWNTNEFKRFCQRARAVLQQRTATCLIAEHV